MYYNNYYDNTFMGYYVNDYNTVLNTPVPTNGNAVLFANLDQGLMYSKKMVNNQSYIQTYRITPVNTEGAPKTDNDILNQILERLEKLEGGNNNESKQPNE